MNARASSETPKSLKHHKRQLKWMIALFFSWLKKQQPFKTSSQVNNTLEEVGVSLPKSAIKRRLYEYKYTEALKQGANHCLHPGTGSSD